MITLKQACREAMEDMKKLYPHPDHRNEKHCYIGYSSVTGFYYTRNKDCLSIYKYYMSGKLEEMDTIRAQKFFKERDKLKNA